MKMERMNLASLALCGILCTSLLSGCDSDAPARDLTTEFTVSQVDLKDVIRQTAEIEPLVKVDLKSEASGTIDSLYVKAGQRVKRGDTLLTIDPTRLNTEKAKLLLSVRKAQLSFSIGKRDYENSLKLYKSGVIPAKKLEDLKNQFELTEITLKERKLELGDIQYQLDKTVIVAPMDGVLIDLPVEAGEIAVSATSGFSGGTHLGRIADVSKLEVITRIGELDYQKIKVGQKVSLSLESAGDKSGSGTVSFISYSAQKEENSTVSTFEVRVSIDSILPGMVPGVNVNAEFIVLDKKEVLGIPYHMVEKKGDGKKVRYFVYRPKGTKVTGSLQKSAEASDDTTKKKKKKGRKFGKKMDQRMKNKSLKRTQEIESLGLVRQRITVGETDYAHYEVLSGLGEGDVVVRINSGASK